MPEPSTFKNRFLTTGGGGLAINSGSDSVAGAIQYGAVGGLTDGGFGSFDTQWDAVFLLANNSVNWESVYMFGYQGIYEMTVLGKAFTSNFYNTNSTSSGTTNSTKLYTYYQACSEGGREGFSQVQRFPETYDGAIIGAPAFRYSFQQVNHLTANVQEQALGYAPPPCELTKILNETLTFCDPLDGKTDGVVSRTDLCKLQFDPDTTIGLPYYCAATTAAAGGMRRRQEAAAATPEQNGTVTAEAAAFVKIYLDGLKNSKGQQIYVPYQPSATFTDPATTYNTETGKWEIVPSGLGAEWVERFLLEQNSSSIPTDDFSTFTAETLADYMLYGLHKYAGVLQTTWPDLSPWRDAGNKVLHFHGKHPIHLKC